MSSVPLTHSAELTVGKGSVDELNECEAQVNAEEVEDASRVRVSDYFTQDVSNDRNHGHGRSFERFTGQTVQRVANARVTDEASFVLGKWPTQHLGR